jgi:HEAT repeat protein
MQQEVFQTISTLLAGTDPDEIRDGLALVKSQLPALSEEEGQTLLEMISALFYIDPLDLPDHVPVIEDAIALVGSMGDWAIPPLLQELGGGDVKAQMAIAQALGHMGAPAIDTLLFEYNACPEPACQNFILYALGKVKAPEIVKAVPAALEAAASIDQEMRDTATRALGKFAESIPAGDLAGEMRTDVLERLRKNMVDLNPALRAKAVRSLGKLARYGHMTGRERWELAATLRGILGQDENYEWDRAYVVRKEAKEALEYAQ